MLLYEAQENLTAYQSIVELSCGAKVMCEKLPGFLLRAFQRSHKEPKPPKKEVKALGGMTIVEEDPEDPEYKKMLDQWTGQTGYDFLEMAMDYMVLLDETKAQALEREDRLERYGMDNTTPNRMDVFVFAEHDDSAIAIYVKQLSDEVMRLSTITPEEVAEAKDNFRSAMDEHPDNGSGNAEEQS